MNTQVHKFLGMLGWLSATYIFKDIEFKILSYVVVVPVIPKLEHDIINFLVSQCLNILHCIELDIIVGICAEDGFYQISIFKIHLAKTWDVDDIIIYNFVGYLIGV